MKKLFTFIILILFFNNISAQKYTEQYIKDASAIGIKWWNQVNNGEHEQSYEALASGFQNRFPLENWLNQMKGLMEEFGEVQERTIKDAYFQSKMEGFEDGFYVIIEYNVEYSKTRNHTETVLLKQNDNFEWKIFDFSYAFQNKMTQN